MGLYKRGSAWWSSFTVNGKRYRLSTGQAQKNEAEKWERAKVSELRGNKATTQLYQTVKAGLVEKQITFAEAWEHFKTFPRKHTPGESAIRYYQSTWEDFVAFAVDNKCSSIADVTEVLSQRYISQIRGHGRYSPVEYRRGGKTVVVPVEKLSDKLSNRTQNAYLVSLKVIFDTLVKGKYCLENPFKEIDKLSNEAVDREAFTPEELRIIGEKSKDTWLYPLFLTGICTGMREGDICLLEWTNIKDGWIKRKTRKTGVEINLPILPPLAAYLRVFPHSGQYVYPELADAYQKDQSIISKAVKRFLADCDINATKDVEGRSRKASIKDVHSLRHTFAYIAAVNNIPLPIVQSILGHMSPTMTQHYIDHARQEEKAKYLATLPDYLSIGTEVHEKAAPDLNDIRARLESMTAENWQTVRDELLAQI